MSLDLCAFLLRLEGSEVFRLVLLNPGLYFLERVDGLDVQGLQLLRRSSFRRLLSSCSLVRLLRFALTTLLLFLALSGFVVTLSFVLSWFANLRALKKLFRRFALLF